MKKFKGTKGDWFIKENNNTWDEDIDIECVVDGDRRRILRIYDGNNEDYANAKLIANAPMMLERLQKIIVEFEKDSLSSDLEDTILDARDFLNREILD